jgi:hypothetical protein
MRNRVQEVYVLLEGLQILSLKRDKVKTEISYTSLFSQSLASLFAVCLSRVFWIFSFLATAFSYHPYLLARVKELQDHNETLKKSLTKPARIKRTLRVCNNYMVQVQTLINKKTIEALGVKKPWWKFW